MKRWIVLGAVAAVAASGAACANSPIAPESAISASFASGVLTTAAKGGNGGGKPGGGGGTSGSGSIALAMVTDNNNDGVPSFNDTVTFVVQTDATAYPWVTLRCYQNGTLVSQESNAVGHGDFTLGPSPLWQSGAADCTATLENWDNYSAKNGSITVLASTSFSTN